MKKIILSILAVLYISFLTGLISCSNGVSVDGGTDDSTSHSPQQAGNIYGKITYSNVEEDNHGGIIVTLDKTDGLNASVAEVSVPDQNISRSARTVVTSCTTSADGSYSFNNLQPGTYTIYASSSYSKEKAVFTNVVVRAAETTVAGLLKLTATGSITGKITIDGQLSGNTGFLVFVAGTSFMAMTDDTGNYTISDIPAGSSYQVVATKNGLIHNLKSSVTVKANEDTNLEDNTFTTAELNAAIKGEKGDQGEQGIQGKKGTDGISMVWLGDYDSENEIKNPKYLDAYFNKTDGCSYIYDGTKWTLLAHSGANGANGADGTDGQDGKNGTSIIWKGELSSAPLNPEVCWAYYNTTTGCSYIWSGSKWDLLSKIGATGAAGSNGTDGKDGKDGTNGLNGTDGLSIIWKGERSSAPANPGALWAYYNTTTGCSYIWNGSKWDLLSLKGDKGDTGNDGADGTDGTSIIWRGTYSSASQITNPKTMNAYYNTTDGCSYIYNGTSWQLLASKGADGTTSSNTTGLRWRGTYSSSAQISSVQPLDAYYNSTDGCSYIYASGKWQLLAQNGNSIRWRGNYADSSYISSPKYLDAYFNTTENCSYIYTGSSWVVLAKGPASGGTGSSSTNVNVGSEVGAIIDGTTLVGWTEPKGVIRIPSGVTAISPKVFYNTDITRVIIPSTVESIGTCAFGWCDELKSVEFLGTGLKVISADAFRYCKKLANIELPKTLQSIGESAFEGCDSLTKVNIPDSVLSVGAYAYKDCKTLWTLTIGKGLAELKNETFRDCDSLVNITIPDTVTTIWMGIFGNCDSLTTVSVSGTWSCNSDSYSNPILTVDYLTARNSEWIKWTRN